MITERERVIQLCKRERDRPGSYGFLPGIIECMEELHELLSLPDVSKATADRISGVRGGLGRLVTEDYSFSESELGTLILENFFENEADE